MFKKCSKNMFNVQCSVFFYTGLSWLPTRVLKYSDPAFSSFFRSSSNSSYVSIFVSFHSAKMVNDFIAQLFGSVNGYCIRWDRFLEMMCKKTKICPGVLWYMYHSFSVILISSVLHEVRSYSQSHKCWVIEKFF